MIFKGQLVRRESTLPKIEQALDAGLRPLVIVHAQPEDALRNTSSGSRRSGAARGSE